MSNVAYPLQWPPGWPKTDPLRRETPKFKQTITSALNFLKREVELLGGKGLVLSSNYTLGAENPKESGVCAYFTYNNMNVAIPCDRWHRIEHNVYAIALTIEAMRGMERWGAKHMIQAMFTGFKALPQSTTGRAWHEVLECHRDSGIHLIKLNYNRLAQERHPDRGGTHEQMVELNNAYEQAMKLRGQT